MAPENLGNTAVSAPTAIMPKTDQLSILKRQYFDHIISRHRLSRSFRTVFYCVNSPVLFYINDYTISIFPDFGVIFPVYLSLTFKIIQIKNSSWKNTTDCLFLFSIQICFKNTAVPFSGSIFFHISTEKNRIIHNAVTLYTIISLYNGSASRRSFLYNLHLGSVSLKFIRISICSSRIFLYIADLSIFIYLVYTVFYGNARTFFSSNRFSK